MVLLFAYAGAVISANEFWTSYQIISVVGLSEEVIGVLKLTGIDDHRSVPAAFKTFMAKKGKATRALYYRIGHFSDFSLGVPIGIWDEIINQLLFLLSF